MPELPEVERVRHTLAQHLPGRKVRVAELRRADVVRGGLHGGSHDPANAAALLAGDRIADILRHGKQLAIVGRTGRCVCVHLGMTGSLRWRGRRERDQGTETGRVVSPSSPNGRRSAQPLVPRSLGPLVPSPPDPHAHLVWAFTDGGTLTFRDPRRFGGIWPFDSVDQLHAERWAALGPDALHITPTQLHTRLLATRRAVKAALLDQHLVAGLGNIYVDELLFVSGLSPDRPAHTLERDDVRRLVRRMRRLLHRAIDAGGSTFRDYVDGSGAAGAYQQHHRVYGRAGLPCHTCRSPLALALIAGRTTVYCNHCQPPARTATMTRQTG